MTKVWESSQQCGTSLLVLLALADWADDWGYCYPGHEAIARKARTTERNAYLIIRKLEEAGEIRILRRGTGGKSRVTSLYQVIVGLTGEEIARSETQSPLALGVSPEKFSPEIYCTPLNVLNNRHLIVVDDSDSQQQQLNDVSPEKFSPEKFSGERINSENQRKSNLLPPDVQDALRRIGWSGGTAELLEHYRSDRQRFEAWLDWARTQPQEYASARFLNGLRSGLLPPDRGEAGYRKYLEGPYAAFINH
jgi:hypothetical protein